MDSSLEIIEGLIEDELQFCVHVYFHRVIVPMYPTFSKANACSLGSCNAYYASIISDKSTVGASSLEVSFEEVSGAFSGCVALFFTLFSANRHLTKTKI
jgi:hypothetical protein